eukprot:CAMPEP_0203768926 /NCGR_PEP_ID=MMETSP0099_2-20121227/1887_1 /ASSEMBLY_ACC=CAM_ASM_000209 /TAXON_ID=96639 /ORGANISM=" , Strain NY0313808BC1" /LENGTH=397 /DNA_ID=CAMNT_0050665727 /DNA_START=354 /DNA_END=1547 /DNA_ORIENTATION=-
MSPDPYAEATSGRGGKTTATGKTRGRPRKTVVEKMQTLLEQVKKHLTPQSPFVPQLNKLIEERGTDTRPNADAYYEQKLKELSSKYRKQVNAAKAPATNAAASNVPSGRGMGTVSRGGRGSARGGGVTGSGRGRGSAGQVGPPGNNGPSGTWVGANAVQTEGVKQRKTYTKRASPAKAANGSPNPSKVHKKDIGLSGPQRSAAIAERLKSDPHLAEIVESTASLRENENDVLFDTGVDDWAENQRLVSQGKTTEMGPAERELAHWPNTHVLDPKLIRSILQEVSKGYTPIVRLPAQGLEPEKIQVEYLARAFQEFLATVVPELVNMARHRRTTLKTESKTETNNEKSKEDQEDILAEVDVQLNDLDALSNVAHYIPAVFKPFLRETCEEQRFERGKS